MTDNAAELAEMLELPAKRERPAPKPIVKREAPFEIQPISFEVQLEMIQELALEYMPLAILDVNNKEEVERVHKAKMTCVKLRTGIDKRRKELKDSALMYGRKVDGAAAQLTEALAPIEEHLKNEAGKVQREKERIEKEAEERRESMVRGRLQLMADAGRLCVATDVSYLSEEEFQADLHKAVKAKLARDEEAAAAAAEQARINEENRIEAARIAKERAELEQQRAEQAAAQAKIDAANKAIADAEAAALRAAEIEQAKREAAEKARLDAIVEQERKVEAERVAAVEAQREQDRIEELRPDREKIMRFADSIAGLVVPVLSGKAKAAAGEIAQALLDAETRIRAAAGKLK